MALFVLLIPLVWLAAVLLFLDYHRPRIIRFRRLGRSVGEIAFDERELFSKLDGDMAEIIMPAKPLIVRLWRRIRPLRMIEGKISDY